MQDAELGKRLADRLVQVATHRHGNQWVYIHIEVQGEGRGKEQFDKRLFVYNYRIFDRYDRPVATLAVLADKSPNLRPSLYGYELFGCRHILEFPNVKLLDYAPASRNCWPIPTPSRSSPRRTS